MIDGRGTDLRRNTFGADLMDVEYSAKEARYTLDHLTGGWMKPKRVHTPLCVRREAALGQGVTVKAEARIDLVERRRVRGPWCPAR